MSTKLTTVPAGDAGKGTQTAPTQQTGDQALNARLTAFKVDGTEIPVTCDCRPDFCPYCGTGIDPRHVFARLSDDAHELYLAVQCPISNCNGVFLVRYSESSTKGHYYSSGTYPQNYVRTQFEDTIQSISPSFVEIYNHAMEADSMGLTQLVGCGLRKALEFLVKDFAISYNSADKDEIVKKRLEKCITTYIADEKVKQIARRAAWLGNDETHYFKKWTGKDIEDLKKLIQMTVNGIENAILAAEYIDSMPDLKN